MTLRGGYPPEGMKEYGMAIKFPSMSHAPTPELINEAGEMVAFNFEMTKSCHPEYGLVNYRFVAGTPEEIDGVWYHVFGWYALAPKEPPPSAGMPIPESWKADLDDD